MIPTELLIIVFNYYVIVQHRLVCKKFHKIISVKPRKFKKDNIEYLRVKKCNIDYVNIINKDIPSLFNDLLICSIFNNSMYLIRCVMKNLMTGYKDIEAFDRYYCFIDYIKYKKIYPEWCIPYSNNKSTYMKYCSNVKPNITHNFSLYIENCNKYVKQRISTLSNYSYESIIIAIFSISDIFDIGWYL